MSSLSSNTAPPHPIPARESVGGRLCPRPTVSGFSGGSGHLLERQLERGRTPGKEDDDELDANTE